ncbi:MAG: Stk1 family PASTA domain-containing Ser/Thr kinase [Limnochordia bacterium]|jgi:serine/threonine-protein kinase|nr:Stk1 family PASTA domain-containing Ser/Thr kinase [Limnochordia bacterium]
MIGEMLADRYEILEKVGDGGMALVYSAKDHLLSRTVAVKILRAQFADDEEFVERFRREARSAASLSHPNIVNIYDVGETEHVHFIVMEYVQGKNLHDLIRDHESFSQDIIVSVGKQIAMGLAHAHYHGIIHRDIKPHNILVTEEGRVKVTDFGIAQAMSTTNLTQTGMVLGSVHYFSPEQARGVNVQAASDLYSLGIVLYEMIAGHPPFRGDSPIAIALKQIQENPLPLRDFRPDLDGELEDLVLKLLNKDPKKRSASTEEVVKAFQRIERRIQVHGDGQGHGDHTMPLPVQRKPRRGGFGLAAKKKKSTKKKTEGKNAPRKSKGLILLLILLLLAGVAAGVVWLIPRILFLDDVRVPNVVGLFELEGRQVLREADLVLRVEQSIFDNEVPAGRIISQEPVAGRSVKQQREILVRISLGAEEMEMPSVIGLSTREGKLGLTQAGFVLGEEEEAYDPEVDPGIVLEQYPEPGQIVLKGTAVNLVVSKGQEAPLSFALPDFRGQDFELVKVQIRELGLPLGNSWPEHSTIYRQGQVVEQNPAPGTQVQAGWSIDFVYSQGMTQAAPEPQIPLDPREEPSVEPQWTNENLWKTQEVTVDVQPGPDQEVVILVIDDFGAREVYREIHKAGSRVVRTVQGRGQNARFQVYIGGRQFHDAPFPE